MLGSGPTTPQHNPEKSGFAPRPERARARSRGASCSRCTPVQRSPHGLVGIALLRVEAEPAGHPPVLAKCRVQRAHRRWAAKCRGVTPAASVVRSTPANPYHAASHWYCNAPRGCFLPEEGVDRQQTSATPRSPGKPKATIPTLEMWRRRGASDPADPHPLVLCLRSAINLSGCRTVGMR